MTVVLHKPGWLSGDQVRRLDHGGIPIGMHTGDHRVTTYTGPDWVLQLDPRRDRSQVQSEPGRACI